MTAAQHYTGLDRASLEQRAIAYERARQGNPQRWSAQARQWAHVDVVHLNPETEQQAKKSKHKQKTACLTSL